MPRKRYKPEEIVAKLRQRRHSACGGHPRNVRRIRSAVGRARSGNGRSDQRFIRHPLDRRLSARHAGPGAVCPLDSAATSAQAVRYAFLSGAGAAASGRRCRSAGGSFGGLVATPHRGRGGRGGRTQLDVCHVYESAVAGAVYCGGGSTGCGAGPDRRDSYFGTYRQHEWPSIQDSRCSRLWRNRHS